MDLSLLDFHFNVDLRWLNGVLDGIIEKVPNQNFDVHSVREDFARSDIHTNRCVR